MKSGIYILTSQSGDKYVGQSVNLDARKKYKEVYKPKANREDEKNECINKRT